MTEAELRAAIQTEARSWVGTPHVHQACRKGVGVDCAMFVRVVGETVGVASVDDRVWQRWAGYSRTPNPRHMGDALRTFLVEIPAGGRKPGDIAWLQWRDDLPMHLAILAERGPRLMLIHAWARAGRNKNTGEPEGRVVEHGFTAEWPGRVVSWWRYPGLVTAQGEA